MLFPFSADAERAAWTTAASNGFLNEPMGGAGVVPDDVVEWTVVPPREVTDTVVEEVLTMADDIVDIVITVDVMEVFASLVPDIITLEVFVPWPSSFSFDTLVVVFFTVESSVDAWVVTPADGNDVVVDVTVVETWELLDAAALVVEVVAGVDIGGVVVSVESRFFCATGLSKG